MLGLARLSPTALWLLALPPAALLVSSCASARYSASPGAPTLVMPAAFAEGSNQGAGGAPPSATAAATASAAGSAADAAAPSASSAPDPEPLRLAEQVEYELELAEGEVKLLATRTKSLAAPIVTPRRMGRYAIELGIGQELIERVRFDFPATAADEVTPGPRKPLRAPLTLSARAIARVKVLVPNSPRVRRALLIDRALGHATPLPWPALAPVAVTPAAPPSAPPGAGSAVPAPGSAVPAAGAPPNAP